jgi:hypothetical protein
MFTLEEVIQNNLLFSAVGMTFVNPVFRKLTGQYPYNLNVYTIYQQDDKKKERNLKRLLDENEKPFIVIVRGGRAELEDVLFVPPRDFRDLIRNKRGSLEGNSRSLKTQSAD